VTSAFSAVEIMVALFYGKILRYNPGNPLWDQRDRFILSKGQASVGLYPILADLGFFPQSDLTDFCQEQGKVGVHLQHQVPGAEITSGSLGMGFGIATGMALAGKLDRKRHLVFTLLGDAECYEGSVWEAAMFAAHNRLNNLVAILDRNFLSATNFTEDMLQLEPLVDKWRAFGWRVKTVDGHSFESILGALENVRSRGHAKPLILIAKTTKGEGISFMCHEPLWHGVPPSGDQAVCASAELDKAINS